MIKRLDFIAAIKLAASKKTKYMWGGIMRPITTSYIEYLAGIPAYKAQYPASRVASLKNYVGQGYYGVDCVGLVKSAYWGGIGSPNYKAATDKNVKGVYDAASVHGNMSTFPKVPGQCVILANFSHIGVYIGDGLVIESTLSSFGDGIVTTKLSDRPWAKWCNCAEVDYSDITTPAPIPVPTPAPTVNTTLKVGDYVKIKAGAVWYGTKTKVPTACTTQAYIISSISGSNVHLDANGLNSRVDAKYLTKVSNTLAVGSTITLKSTAHIYGTTKKFASFVYSTQYTVISLTKDAVVFGIGTAVTGKTLTRDVNVL